MSFFLDGQHFLQSAYSLWTVPCVFFWKLSCGPFRLRSENHPELSVFHGVRQGQDHSSSVCVPVSRLLLRRPLFLLCIACCLWHKSDDHRCVGLFPGSIFPSFANPTVLIIKASWQVLLPGGPCALAVVCCRTGCSGPWRWDCIEPRPTWQNWHLYWVWICELNLFT